jgi:hypothetical protein
MIDESGAKPTTRPIARPQRPSPSGFRELVIIDADYRRIRRKDHFGISSHQLE